MMFDYGNVIWMNFKIELLANGLAKRLMYNVAYRLCLAFVACYYSLLGTMVVVSY